MNEGSIFHEALTKSHGERAGCLDQAWAAKPELRAAVAAVWAAQSASGNLLELAAVAAPEGTGDYVPAAGDEITPRIPQPRTTDYQPATGPGAVIAGRYTLLEKIGEGGMGEVWVAKQTEPVKRKIALKLIKAGMDTRAVLQRFEQERQALAMMDHPNIARVLDGGMTPNGQPFFVME